MRIVGVWRMNRWTALTYNLSFMWEIFVGWTHLTIVNNDHYNGAIALIIMKISQTTTEISSKLKRKITWIIKAARSSISNWMKNPNCCTQDQWSFSCSKNTTENKLSKTWSKRVCGKICDACSIKYQADQIDRFFFAFREGFSPFYYRNISSQLKCYLLDLKQQNTHNFKHKRFSIFVSRYITGG